MKKNKKEKIVYYDDGSTLADMSALSKNKASTNNEASAPKYGFIAKMQTFFGAMRLMLIPLAATVCALGIIYAVIYLLFSMAR